MISLKTAYALLAFTTASGPDGQPEPPARGASESARSRSEFYRNLILAYFKDEAEGGKLGWDHFAPRFKDLAEKQPDDFIGYESLYFLVGGEEPGNPYFDRSIDLLTRFHAVGNRVGEVCRGFGSPRYFGRESAKVEAFLKEVAAKNPEPDIRAEATFGLALFLKNKATLARQLAREDGSRLASKIEAAWGPTYLKTLRAGAPESSSREAERVLKRGRGEFPGFWNSHPVAGSRAPAIVGEDIGGAPMRLDEFRGKVVVLSFWGFGCLPCRAMLAHEKTLVERLKGRSFVLLGVNNDPGRAEARKLASEQGITWRSWWDGGETGNPIAQAWVIRTWPAVFVIDAEGLIRYADVRGKALDVVIDSLLLESEGGHRTADRR